MIRTRSHDLLPDFSKYGDLRITFLKDRNPAPPHEFYLSEDLLRPYLKWGFPTPTPSKAPVTPERVILALRNDPPLLWEVLNRLREERVLAPWNNCGLDDWWERKDPKGFNVATVRREDRPGVKPWRWDIFAPGANEDSPIRGKGWYDTAKEAQVTCDAYLVESGWMLA